MTRSQIIGFRIGSLVHAKERGRMRRSGDLGKHEGEESRHPRSPTIPVFPRVVGAQLSK